MGRIVWFVCLVSLVQGFVHQPLKVSSVLKAASVVAETDFELVLPMSDATRAVISMSPHACRDLADQVNTLIASFRTKAGEAQRKPNFQYASPSENDISVQMECNPNLFPDPFKAKIHVRLRSAQLDITSEVALTTLIDQLKLVLAN